MARARARESDLRGGRWEHGIESAVRRHLAGRYYERRAEYAVSAAQRVLASRDGDLHGAAAISPYLTEHINRFGEYSTHELGIRPEAYDPKLDVDFTPLREQDPTAAGFGQGA
ncbi:hypothetical protein ACFRJ3_35105 [Streptomyces sp. NPDC056696]|uniref:hypothetical protein n=1 Tax=Streptomyces sp. NPDC056696 TaxID=3345914 RepID=UPI0036B3A009